MANKIALTTNKLKSGDKDISTNTSKKSSSLKKVLPLGLGIAVIAIISLGVIISHKNVGQVAGACTDILNPNCWSSEFKPQLEQADQKTNVLLLGSDTRGNNANPGNTDTIILGTIDYANKTTRMLSIPRDVSVAYTINNKTYHNSKINQIYEDAVAYSPDHKGKKIIAQTVSQITGEKIQYVGIIRLQGVIEVIDQIGGIEVNISPTHVDTKIGIYQDVYPESELPDSLKATCQTPDRYPGAGWCVFKFKPGIMHMDGQTALIYARMREWTSDFDRESRQHDVINAIKSKVLDDQAGILDRANKLIKLYSSLTNLVDIEDLTTGQKINPDLQTILAALNAISGINTDPAKIILDPSFAGGKVIVPVKYSTNYIFTDLTFNQVQQKLKFIYDNLSLYKERATIYCLNETGIPWKTNADNQVLALRNSDFWFLDIVAGKAAKTSNAVNVEIIDYSGGKKQVTMAKLQELLANYKVKITTADNNNNLQPSNHLEDIGINFYSAVSTTIK